MTDHDRAVRAALIRSLVPLRIRRRKHPRRPIVRWWR